MATYKVGALSLALSEDKEETVDDLFKCDETDLGIDQDQLQTLVNDNSEVKTNAKQKPSKKKKKKVKVGVDEENETSVNNEAENSDSDPDSDEIKYTNPSKKFRVLHEEENRGKERDLEREKRTIFLGNLPNDVTKAKIKQLFKKFGDIETIRLRGAARPDMKTTKRVAMIQRKFHENRNSIIAFVRFKSEESVTKSLTLNGEKLLGDRTMRVDTSARDNEKDSDGKRDQSKAIFVGNLGFAVDEEEVHEHFAKCGKIVNVRIIRDSKTGIGKGFCYVNFSKSQSAKMALDLMNGTTLSGRELRVSKSVERPKKTVTMVPTAKAKGAFVSQKAKANLAKSKTTIKVKKNTIKKSFEGKKFDEKAGSGKKEKKNRKKPSQGERQRKKIAKQLMG